MNEGIVSMEQRIVDFTEYFGMRDTGYGIPECVCIKHNEALYKMYESLFEGTKGKTVIYISHRLASAVLADTVFVFDDGVTAEKGTHKELLNKGGIYAEMFLLQKASYTKDGDIF